MVKKEVLKYNILTDQFQEVGPILIGNGSFSSEGLKVQFFPNEKESWVGNFVKGFTSLTGVYLLAQSQNILVLANGYLYIVDPRAKQIIKTIHSNHSEIIENNGNFILTDDTRVIIINSEGDVWKSERISYDGIKDLKLNNDTLSGLSSDPTNLTASWVPFLLNLKTKKLTGGSYIK